MTNKNEADLEQIDSGDLIDEIVPKDFVKSMAEDYATERKNFLLNIEEFLVISRETCVERLRHFEKISEKEQKELLGVLDSIDLLEKPEPILDFCSDKKRILSQNFINHSAARSFFRRHRINRLDYEATFEKIKSEKDEEFRNKLFGMFNALVIFAQEHKDPKSLAFMMRYGFLILRLCQGIKVVPFLGSKIFEQAKAL